MEKMKRTHACGELSLSQTEKEVILNGWVHRLRDYGGITFINLRDRSGVVQAVVESDAPAALRERAASLKFEYCVAVRGTVRARPESMRNPEMKTGDLEVKVFDLEILSTCETLPFMIDGESEAKEDARLRYRYLDLRTSAMQDRIRLRHETAFAAREYLVGRGFYEIETPTFIRSTPEGARDFLVPSRVQPGKFYALPQSPQLYKQLLMVSGFERYFQIARCYRDEDSRGDRQPEFTQIDLEMSFVSREDVFEVTEGMMRHIFKKVMKSDLAVPFRRLPYDEAMSRYGSDKPDLRFGLELKDFGAPAAKSDFQVFKTVLAAKGLVKALVAPGCGEYSRKQITDLEETAKTYGAKGLAWMKVTKEGRLEGGVAKFFEKIAAEVVADLAAKPGDLLLFVADKPRTACVALGAVRTRLGADLKLAKPGDFLFAWIVDFPLFEYNEEEKRWDPAHHLFSMPQEKYLDMLESDPGSVKADLYDLVCNGVELASGSIRIHDPKLQARVFAVIGITMAEAERRFGFLLEAFKYGPPPHGGIGIGFDRFITLLVGVATIREVIAFPKNTVGASAMDDCPSSVDEKQLKDLRLMVIEEEK
ncbi:MAG: aspartate--tRNA ligase [Spirochaetales bacterium]|nr:aspartate--tRNA ligase [Spirochaetales bacterium]